MKVIDYKKFHLSKLVYEKPIKLREDVYDKNKL